MTVLVGASYRVVDAVAVELVLGRSDVSFSKGDESLSWTSVTNPYLAAHYVQASGPMRIRAGFGITLPLAEGNPYAAVYNWFLRGLRDVWLFLPDHLGVVLSTRAETDLADGGAVLAGDAEIGTLVPSGEDADETEMVLQLGGEAAARLGPHVLVGGRLTASWLMTESDGDSDFFQTAIVPFVRGQIDPGFLEARLLVNLDRPLGFAFENANGDLDGGLYGGWWTFVLRAGADFE
jgi:hypothetical protein